jgi:hypothetical protein
MKYIYCPDVLITGEKEFSPFVIVELNENVDPLLLDTDIL